MASIKITAATSNHRYWRDVWAYRELFYFLAWRDILVRYKQTVIGVAWAVIRPLLTLIVFTIIFGKIARLPSDGAAPYSLMVAVAMLPWMFFSTALSECSGSLVGSANLISKIYFPRLIVPASAMMASLVDFAISSVVILGLVLWHRWVPGWQLLLLPAFTLVALAAALGPGIWFAALNVKYRDFRYIVPFIVQFGLYITPVGFSSRVVPASWQMVYSLNPMVGVIDAFRWSFLRGESNFNWVGFGMSATISAIMLIGGIWYFRRVERTFADTI